MGILEKWKTKLSIAVKRWLTRLGIIKGDGVYYVGSAEVLPPPLKREEEDDLLLRLQAGDDSVRSIFIERNLRLVVYIARKFENTGIGIEDLVSIGTIGLIKAVNTFDPLKKIKLATYASRCIENEILMFIRKTSVLRGEVSIDEPLNTDWDGNELLLSDVIGTDEDSVSRDIERSEDEKTIRCAIAELEPRERMIIELRYGFGGGPERTQKDVADMLGISQS
ncbi:MAG: RNA polymerase sporulation sigma factor SigE, partial [Selenomonadales bacterium]|nr:RNA polymerase sporulation sigma factor SigE [Selenomonadales bacterium]